MRPKIRDLRRRELVEATREVIAESGFEQATIADISRKAGFSMGYIHHHFRNKDEILLETKRVLYGDMRDFLVQNLEHSIDPIERLSIIIEANFRPHQYSPGNAYTWLSFIARVPFNPAFARFQTIIERRLRSNLLAALKQLLPAPAALQAADEFALLIDAYWLRLGSRPETISSPQAIAAMQAALTRLLAQE